MKFRLSGSYLEEVAIRNYKPHTGIDLAMPEGTELRAIANGIVDRVYDGSDAIGKGVSIKLENGTRAIYGHMDDVSVNVGDKVSFGDSLGVSGSTGHSTGGHLHFALRETDGDFVDPTPLAEKLADISGDITPSVLDAYEKSGFITRFLMKGVDAAGDTIREKVASTTVDILYGVFQGLADFLVQTSGVIALYGGGLLILAIAVGWSDGKKYLGLLLLGNVLIKYFLGGA